MKQFPPDKKRQKRDPAIIRGASGWKDAFDNARIVSPGVRAAVPRARYQGARGAAVDLFGADEQPHAFDTSGIGDLDGRTAPVCRGARLPVIPARVVSEDEHWDRVRPALEKEYM